MNLDIGIVGLPNAGKSTLFNALASRRLAETAARPFTTIKPHEAVVSVPDSNLERLSQLIIPERTIAATVTFIDIAGLVKGAHQGRGLGNQFLAKIRQVKAILHVVRAFYDPQVVSQHEEGEIGSLKQIFADIDTVNQELVLGQIKDKPTLIILNVGEEDVYTKDTQQKIVAVTEKFKTDALAICAKIEEELMDFDERDRKEYLKNLGISETGLSRIIRYAYQMIGLLTFYTIKGGREIHAWSLKMGSTALEAAAKVHSDFAQHFIKAEVINVEELLKSGSWKNAKDSGKVRLEGRAYPVHDKDVIEFKFNK